MTRLALGCEPTAAALPGAGLLSAAALGFRQLSRLLEGEATTTSYLRPIFHEGTSADPAGFAMPSLLAAAPNRAAGDEILELRRLTGLGWEQLADLLGVTRRALHFWTNGRPINAANEEHVHRTLAVIRYADRGSAEDNRVLLLTPCVDGSLLRDLLRTRAYDAFLVAAGRGPGRPAQITTPLSAEERERRRPSAPALLLEAIQEPLPDTHQPASVSRRFSLKRPSRG
jgi:DNA-binding transcriptional regulator YiaG